MLQQNMVTNTSPQDLLHAAVNSNSVEQLAAALSLVRSQPSHDDFLRKALWHAAYAGLPELVSYLLSQGAPPTSLTASAVGHRPSIRLFEVLLAHGWDVNQADAAESWGAGRRAIDFVTRDYELVRWLLDHGARVDSGEFDYLEKNRLLPHPAPLLEKCALAGSAAVFKLLYAQGALLGNRTLQQAAGAAASVGADPGRLTVSEGEKPRKQGDDYSRVEGEEHYNVDEGQYKSDREEILRFLVDDLGVHVNAVDSTRPNLSFHYGTAINYAAKWPRGASVVRWLLEKGADPDIRGPERGENAEGLARREKCDEVLEVLKEWKGNWTQGSHG